MTRLLADMALVSGALQTSWAAVAEQQWLLLSVVLALVVYGVSSVSFGVRETLQHAPALRRRDFHGP